MPERNTELAVAVVRDGRKQYIIAAAAGVHPSDFTKIVSGKLTPGVRARQGIAEALGVDESEIFPEVVAS